jgi:pyruvate formate lyase activating enzyme
MRIKHIEKATFIDYPGKIACTIFIYGCPFRCGFCYNPSLVIKEGAKDLQEEEILDFLKSRKGILEAVCFTGGEPLMSIDINFLAKIKSLGLKIKIDTNGSYSEKLQELIDKKLVDYVAMDIKSSKELYEKTIGINFPIEKIEESIKIVSRLPEYEFRTTILKNIHTKENFKEMMDWIKSITQKEIPNFSLQGFKNHGDFVDNKYKQEPNTTEEYLKELKEIANNYCKQVNVKY